MDDLDKKIWDRGTDNILNAQDELNGKIASWIEERVLALGSKLADRSEIMEVEVDIAMLCQLTKYFGNNMTKKTDAMLWKHGALSFFDSESKNRGDENHPDIKEWRVEIESNFDRLIDV